MKSLILLIYLLFFSQMTFAAKPILGFNVTDLGGEFGYLPSIGNKKTNAQIALDEIKKLGFTHAVINVRAHMIGPRSSTIVLVTKDSEIKLELEGLTELVNYGHSLGLTVGLRPILLVLGPHNEFPYSEGDHLWWHGNINPTDRAKWFDNFEKFILHYAEGLSKTNIDEFTIGAEMQSMMVGMGTTDTAYLMGQPERWLQLLRKVKTTLTKTKVTYDINFPETLVPLTGSIGGEFERWRHLLVDLKDTRSNLLLQKRSALAELWNELDFVGLDFYRYLATSTLNLPKDFDGLANQLSNVAMTHATQIDNSLSDISFALGVEKQITIKEVGYRSVQNCFINPASYSEDGGKLNIMHQAASYKALSFAFVKAGWPWLRGIYFWDISVNPSLKGALDKGFSPLEKNLTLEIIKSEYVNYISK